MSDHPQSDRLEAVLTLSKGMVRDLMVALEIRCRSLKADQTQCQEGTHEHRVLGVASAECYEMLVELSWHHEYNKPYRYVVPLTPEEGRAINEELNGGHGSTHP